MDLFEKREGTDNRDFYSAPLKSGKKTGKYITAVIGVIFSLYFLRILLGPAEFSGLINIKDSEWKVQNLRNTRGLSIESPFVLKQTYYEESQEKDTVIISFHYNSRLIDIRISYFKLGLVYADVDTVVKTTMDEICSQKENYISNYTIDTLTYNNLPFRIVKAKYNSNNQLNGYIGFYCAEVNRIWEIQCSYIYNETNSKIAERIINSVKIEDN